MAVAAANRLRRLKVPETARYGEIVTVKTLAEHRMEPGVRFDPRSLVVYPRFILNKVECRVNGRLVFRADWYSGVSANPYMAFKIRAEESGVVEVAWTDDYNAVTRATARMEVIGAPERDLPAAPGEPRGDG